MPGPYQGGPIIIAFFSTKYINLEFFTRHMSVKALCMSIIANNSTILEVYHDSAEPGIIQHP